MTGDALRQRQFGRMRGFLDRGVAVDAVELAMDRAGEFRRLHSDPLRRLTLLARFELRLMAVHAFAVSHGRRRLRRSGFDGTTNGGEQESCQHTPERSE